MQQLGTSLTNHDRTAQNSGILPPHHGLYVLNIRCSSSGIHCPKSIAILLDPFQCVPIFLLHHSDSSSENVRNRLLMSLVFPSQKDRVRYVLTYYYRQDDPFIRTGYIFANDRLSWNISYFYNISRLCSVYLFYRSCIVFHTKKLLVLLRQEALTALSSTLLI